MTELVAPASPRPAAAPAAAGRKRKPGFMPTVFLALATFAVIFEFLAFQLNNGNDPALGKSVLAANDPKAAKVARPIVNRRIIKTKVVHLPPRSTATAAATGTTVPVTSSAGSSTPSSSTVTSSAPVPAPAPAPAPAPVTSSS